MNGEAKIRKMKRTELKICEGVEHGRSLKCGEMDTGQYSRPLESLESVPSSSIRSRNQASLYFKGWQKPDLKATAPKVFTVLRLIYGPKNTARLEPILAVKFGMRHKERGPIIDEIDGKLFIGMVKTSKSTSLTVEEHELQSSSLTIQEYQLKLSSKDEYGNTKLSVLKPNKPITLAIEPLEMSDLDLFVWPDDGTLMFHGKCADEIRPIEHIEIGWLEHKKKSDRVLFAHYLDINVRMPPASSCFSIFPEISRTETSISLLFCPRKYPEFASWWQVVSVKKSGSGSTFECYRNSIIKTPKLFPKLPFKLENLSTRIVGKIFKAWLVVFMSPKDQFPQLVAFRPNAYGATVCKLKLQRPNRVGNALNPAPFDMICANLVVTDVPDHRSIGVRKVDLNQRKHAKQLKMYRFCAKCGKQEHRKRTNQSGKRIAHFKICRECKKLDLHRAWQSHPCHYCSWECVKADWPKHKLLHL